MNFFKSFFNIHLFYSFNSFKFFPLFFATFPLSFLSLQSNGFESFSRIKVPFFRHTSPCIIKLFHYNIRINTNGLIFLPLLASYIEQCQLHAFSLSIFATVCTEPLPNVRLPIRSLSFDPVACNNFRGGSNCSIKYKTKGVFKFLNPPFLHTFSLFFEFFPDHNHKTFFKNREDKLMASSNNPPGVFNLNNLLFIFFREFLATNNCSFNHLEEFFEIGSV